MRVLLVSHEASRTGAPRVAALVARSLVEQGHDVTTVARVPGPLLPDLEAVSPTSVEPFHRVRRKLWRTPLLKRVAFLVDTVLAAATVLHRRPDLVWVNSTAAAIYLRPALWLGRPVVLHSHESGEVAVPFLERSRAPDRLVGTTLVACSPSVRDDLMRLADRGEDEVFLLPSVPDSRTVQVMATAAPDTDYLPDELVVGCCGTVEHRKGADLWPDIVREVRATMTSGRSVRFVWLGEPAGPLPDAVGTDVEFLGPSSNPYAHLRRFDILGLPSRDDPFPLVVLEAMLLGTPVVAFDVGGVSQQIGDSGVVVSSNDLPAFATAVAGLLDDDTERARLGASAEARAAELFSVGAFATNVAGVVSAASSAPGGPGSVAS